MTKITPSTIELEEVDSGLQQSTEREFSEDSGGSPAINIEEDQDPIPPLEDSSFTIAIGIPSALGPDSSGSTVGGSESTGIETSCTPDQDVEELSTAATPDSANEEESGAPHGQKLTFVRSIRVSGPSGRHPQASSTPLRSNFYPSNSTRKIVHFVRPVPEITDVRINRAYELRFTENQENKYLRHARTLSYRQYINMAKLFHKVPRLELGAGFP